MDKTAALTMRRPLTRRRLMELAAALGAGCLTGCDRRDDTAVAADLLRSMRGTGARGDAMYRLRCAMAQRHHQEDTPSHVLNGDETRYPSRAASYSKGLPHRDDGEVEPYAFDRLVAALNDGGVEGFRAVPMGGTLELANPRAAYAFPLVGCDSHAFALPAPPALASSEAAADMLEVYWHALARDIPFDAYGDHSLVRAACSDLTRCSGFSGPRRAQAVIPELLFRGSSAGDAVGPYVSQFLYASVPHGVLSLEQRFRSALPGRDFLTVPEHWLANQRGASPVSDLITDPERRFIRTGRDLARYVYRDYTFQAFLNAALILLRLGDQYVSPNPYVQRACIFDSRAPRLAGESGFATYGGPQILDAVTAVANLALEASWHQKWLLHRRLRPEAMAHRVDATVRRQKSYPLNASLLNADVIEALPKTNKLLPLAYPEGAPAHPSYPAGHAAIAGACATVLKAFFREDAECPAAVVPESSGEALVPYEGPTLTVGGEIDKLASNVSMGRNFAGIHYRSDAVQGLRLGEAVARAYLLDLVRCGEEDGASFVFTTFDGMPICVGTDCRI